MRSSLLLAAMVAAMVAVTEPVQSHRKVFASAHHPHAVHVHGVFMACAFASLTYPPPFALTQTKRRRVPDASTAGWYEVKDKTVVDPRVLARAGLEVVRPHRKVRCEPRGPPCCEPRSPARPARDPRPQLA